MPGQSRGFRCKCRRGKLPKRERSRDWRQTSLTPGDEIVDDRMELRAGRTKQSRESKKVLRVVIFTQTFICNRKLNEIHVI